MQRFLTMALSGILFVSLATVSVAGPTTCPAGGKTCPAGAKAKGAVKGCPNMPCAKGECPVKAGKMTKEKCMKACAAKGIKCSPEACKSGKCPMAAKKAPAKK